MPKATQKQKLQKADFSKAKLKLGKGKQQPSNATNTSFKARSIALPGQSVLTRALQDPSAGGEPTTAAGLGLDEVLFKTRHPNAGVKRDAIQGIKDILSVRPTLESGKVLATLGSLIADEDASVRKALYNLLSWYLSIARPVLAPHLPMLTLLVSSALSHIFAEIRLDAAKIVSLLLENDQLERTDANGVLQGLCLALGSNPPAKHKLVYLTAIELYVRPAPTLPAAADKSAASQGQGQGYALPILEGADLAWQIGEELKEVSSDNAKIYEQLYPTLLSTFLEAIPAIPARLETDLCVSIASIAEALADRPVDLLKRMDAYFPFSTPDGAISSGVPADVRLNTAYSSMAIRCRGDRLDGVTDWVIDLLAPSSDVLETGPTVPVFEQSQSVITALLKSPRARDVAEVILSFAIRQVSTSPMRTAVDGYIIRMINEGSLEPTTQWLESLPRVLWELGSSNETASGELLLFLLRFGQKHPGQNLSAIPPRLAAFYTVPAKRPIYTRLGKETQRLAQAVATVWAEFDPSDKLESIVPPFPRIPSHLDLGYVPNLPNGHVGHASHVLGHSHPHVVDSPTNIRRVDSPGPNPFAVPTISVPTLDTVRFVALCILWYGSSALSSNTGKVIMTAFRFPVTLTIIQFFFVAGLCFVGANLGWSNKLRTPTRAIVQGTLPMAAFQVGGHICSSLAISRVPVSTVHTIKALSPLFTVFAYAILFSVSYSAATYLSLLPLTFGVMLACSSDLSASNIFGLVCAFGSTLIFVSQNIFFKKIMPTNAETTSHGKLDKINLLYFSSGMAFLLMVPVWIYSDFWRLFYFTNTSDTSTTRLVVYFTLNGVVHFAQNLLAFAILSSTSPVTYSIASLVKRIAVICLAIVWFKQSVHATQALGIALTAVGLWMYNNAKRDVEKGEKKMRQVEAVREGALPLSVEKAPGSPRPSYSVEHSSALHRSGFEYEHVEPPPKGQRRRLSDHLSEKPFHLAMPRNGPLPELVAQ